MNIDLLRRLCETPGVPGHEHRVRDLILKEIEGDGRYCLATFGNPLGDYQIVQKDDFDAKAMKQKGAIFLNPAIEVKRFSWSMGIWRHGRVFGDDDAATKLQKRMENKSR